MMSVYGVLPPPCNDFPPLFHDPTHRFPWGLLIEHTRGQIVKLSENLIADVTGWTRRAQVS